MSIISDRSRLNEAKLKFKTWLSKKGAAVTDSSKINDMVDMLETVEAGPDVSGVTATAADVRKGKIFVDADGNEVAGTIPDVAIAKPVIEVAATGLITATVTQDEGYVSEGRDFETKLLSIQSAKTVTPSTEEQTVVEAGKYTTGAVKVAAVPTQTKTVAPSKSSQEVTPADDKFLSKVTVEAMPVATQATPTIEVSDDGVITASATQTAGYVDAGTKSSTKQLTVQEAKIVTPTTSTQVAVPAGTFVTGDVTVAANEDLSTVISNIQTIVG